MQFKVKIKLETTEKNCMQISLLTRLRNRQDTICYLWPLSFTKTHFVNIVKSLNYFIMLCSLENIWFLTLLVYFLFTILKLNYSHICHET